PLDSTLFLSPVAPRATSPLSLHDALPICFATRRLAATQHSSRLTQPTFHSWLSLATEVSSMRFAGEPARNHPATMWAQSRRTFRSEEHTSELQSRFDIVCRLLLEKHNKHH